MQVNLMNKSDFDNKNWQALLDELLEIQTFRSLKETR